MAEDGNAVASREFIYEKFADYYSNSSLNVPQPTLMGQREFGFLLLKERAMVRHKSFMEIKDLRRFLSENVPSDVYHSCAYYENPSFEMDKKGWLGADLVFDIDADHIPTLCNKIHDEWTCGKCGFAGKGITPETCPVCGGVKFDTKTWPCELCLNSAKEETVKLVDMLEKDFGFASKEIRVFFSGHRGYHVQVEAEAVRMLDAMARKEIVDYVSGLGLALLEEQASEKTVTGRRRRRGSGSFSLHDFGWNKRLKAGMRKFILNATKDDLRAVGIRSYALLQNKDAVLSRCLEEGRWDSVKGVSVETWRRIARHVKELESAKIDTVVTTDLHRLIRMDGTLHGKTGLLKKEFPAERLTSFDPFVEAVAFKEGTAKVSISDAPEFRLSGKVFGPYRNEVAELPTAAAVLLICKGRAEVV
ncbi:MAG: DNA primase small subunit PriS [Candidatus Bathyarchaeota archaeon]|nr:DNA primase small subunit PriS [Candidatus Bathyarchaeota archaeon]